jgi:hypothetical protein
MKNPLFSSSLFDTPESFEDLQNYIEMYSGQDKSFAYVVSMLTLNLCHKLVEQEISRDSHV